MKDCELWEKKKGLVRLLNKGDYQEYINYMMNFINVLDIQFCEIFISGFDITKAKLLPKNLIQKIDSFSENFTDFRSVIRWGFMKGGLDADISVEKRMV